MERDFLGLGTNNSSHVIKHEIHDLHIDHHSVAQRGPGMQWCFPDSVLNTPPAVSSNSHPEEKPMRSILDQVSSPQFVAASTTDNYGQRNMISRQSGYQIGSASSPLEQSGARQVYHPERFKLRCFTNNPYETTSPGTNYPLLQSHTFATEHHLGRSTSNSPSVDHVQSMPPASRVPSPTCFPTYTDVRSSRKPLTALPQMTIFYAGSVSVYDNIAPEKARAIMLLAGNKAPSTTATMVPSTQPQAHYRKPSPHEIVPVGNPAHETSSSGLVNQVSIFSPIESQSGGVSIQRTMTSSQQQPESSQVVYPQRSSIGYAIRGPVPQARKASLARFLERRKERVTNSHPYPVEQSSEQERNKSASDEMMLQECDLTKEYRQVRTVDQQAMYSECYTSGSQRTRDVILFFARIERERLRLYDQQT